MSEQTRKEIEELATQLSGWADNLPSELKEANNKEQIKSSINQLVVKLRRFAELISLPPFPFNPSIKPACTGQINTTADFANFRVTPEIPLSDRNANVIYALEDGTLVNIYGFVETISNPNSPEITKWYLVSPIGSATIKTPSDNDGDPTDDKKELGATTTSMMFGWLGDEIINEDPNCPEEIPQITIETLSNYIIVDQVDGDFTGEYYNAWFGWQMVAEYMKNNPGWWSMFGEDGISPMDFVAWTILHEMNLVFQGGLNDAERAELLEWMLSGNYSRIIDAFLKCNESYGGCEGWYQYFSGTIPNRWTECPDIPANLYRDDGSLKGDVAQKWSTEIDAIDNNQTKINCRTLHRFITGHGVMDNLDNEEALSFEEIRDGLHSLSLQFPVEIYGLSQEKYDEMQESLGTGAIYWWNDYEIPCDVRNSYIHASDETDNTHLFLKRFRYDGGVVFLGTLDQFRKAGSGQVQEGDC